VEQVPAYVRELFWEDLREEPDPDRHADYIAIRVLEHGDEAAYRWLVGRLGRASVGRTVASGRLRPQHARFWRRVLLDA
jgi:hypothetical protein